MKTFDRRPSVGFDSSPNPGEPQNDDLDILMEMWKQRLPYARRVAVMSVIPGLGQLRNGEIAKGLLFLAIDLANVALIVSMAAGEKLKPWLSSIAASMQRQPNWSLGSPFETGLTQTPAMVIYAILLMAFVAYAVRDAYDSAVRKIRSGKSLPVAQLTLSEATSGSYLVHLAVIISFVFTIILFVTPVPKVSQIVDIQLQPQEKPKQAKPAPKPPAPKKAPPKLQPKPIVHPKPVVIPKHVQPPRKVEPPKPAPVAVAVPTKEPTPLALAPVEAPPPAPPAPAPVVTAPSGATAGAGGGTGGTGAGSSNGDADVDMGPYMRELQKRIKAHWYPPKGNENKRIKVTFKVYKDGHIGRVKMLSPSGVTEADDAAQTAVEQAAPFAHLPEGVGDDVDINFTFDYHVFGSGSGRF
ncbi:MAG TPA: TonB family protein [Candidatus Obscuribacterales bacterium]